MSYPISVNTLFGKTINDLCKKYDIKFNENELQRLNLSKEQFLSLLANNTAIIDKIFVFKDANSNIKGLFEIKEQNDKEFYKYSNITSMIRYFLTESLTEEAIAIYLHNLKMTEIELRIRQINAEKSSEKYAQQGRQYDAEHLRLQEEWQKILNAEMALYLKVHNHFYSQLLGHMEAIKRLDQRLVEIEQIEQKLINEYSNELADDLNQLIPLSGNDKILREKECSNFYNQYYALEKQEQIIEATKMHHDLKIHSVSSKLEDINKQIVQLRRAIISDPNFKSHGVQGNAMINTFHINKLLNSPLSQFKPLINKQDNEEIKAKFHQLDALEEQMKSLSTHKQHSVDETVNSNKQLNVIKKDKHELVENFAQKQVKSLPQEERAQKGQQVKDKIVSHFKNKEGSMLHRLGKDRRDIHREKMDRIEKAKEAHSGIKLNESNFEEKNKKTISIEKLGKNINMDSVDTQIKSQAQEADDFLASLMQDEPANLNFRQ